MRRARGKAAASRAGLYLPLSPWGRRHGAILPPVLRRPAGLPRGGAPSAMSRLLLPGKAAGPAAAPPRKSPSQARRGGSRSRKHGAETQVPRAEAAAAAGPGELGGVGRELGGGAGAAAVPGGPAGGLRAVQGAGPRRARPGAAPPRPGPGQRRLPRPLRRRAAGEAVRAGAGEQPAVAGRLREPLGRRLLPPALALPAGEAAHGAEPAPRRHLRGAGARPRGARGGDRPRAPRAPRCRGLHHLGGRVAPAAEGARLQPGA